MKSAWILAVIIASFCQEANSFQWTSNINDGQKEYACENQIKILPWNFSLETQEKLEDIKWDYLLPNGTRVDIANLVNRHFTPVSDLFTGRLNYVAEGGILLNTTKAKDSGTYTVRVLVLENSTTYIQYTRSLILDVTNGSGVTVDGTLVARQEEDPVFDINTAQLAVQLSCGNISVAGNLPVSVDWTSPTGATTRVYTQTNGKFFYNLPNPIQGGKYTCRLASESPPLSCLAHDNKLFQNSSVIVDEVKARLTLVEGKQKILQAENTNLKEAVRLLKEENQRLNNSEKTLQNELNRTKNYLEELESKRVRFDVRVTGNPYYIGGQRIRFDEVITNENNAYNQDSGIFTAPFNGTYFFVVTGAQYSDRDGGLVLADDDTDFCRLQIPIAVSIAVSCHTTVYLGTGQQVWVKSDGQVYLSSPFSSFVGFSLDPDVTEEL